MRSPAYSNRSLGIPQGSRIGTKQPLSDAKIRAFQERMERLGRPKIGALLGLQRALGLRAMEAVRAGQEDTLHRLHRELAQSGCARVFGRDQEWTAEGGTSCGRGASSRSRAARAGDPGN
ncbi:integrase domain-containing protein [Steroidobacter sp.]|uniref:integrase domain-containing protein n=1 Tax=Steroidobacter sp. TaxID=1978227 RepID=UPI0039C8FC51